jgi:hypothetical protein
VRSWTTGFAVLVATLTSAGCDGSDDDEPARQAQVYVATIRDVLDEQRPPSDPDVLPVVYVVGGGQSNVPADVQAEVVVELHEDADINFEDERSDALLVEDDTAPVRNEGILVIIGEVPPEGDPVDVDVEVYRSVADWSRRVFTVAGAASQWTVTSTSVVLANNA